MPKDRIQEPIVVRLAEALRTCIDELDEYRPENLDTIHWAEDVLADYGAGVQ